MKRFLTILFTTLLLTTALCLTASASSFDGAAEELSAIGVFRGSSSGFQLDQVPTRSQAAIMLVRLYGAEEEAQAAYASGELSHPFTDVGETAAPYVAWLVENGLANGTSPTTFGAADPCTAKAYTVFLLRALGYKDGVDFAFADAQAFGMSLGLYTPSSITGGTFLRDDLAALTYQALACDMKDGGSYLLDSLIQDGAVDSAAAKSITDKIETYRALQEITTDTMAGSMDADIKMAGKIASTITGQSSGTPFNMSENMDLTASGSTQIVLKEGDMQMAMDLSLAMNDETTEAGYWLKDGAMYVRSGDTAYKQDIPEMAELYQAAMMPDTANVLLLPFLKSASSAASGTNTIYTLTLNDALANSFSKSVDELVDLMIAELGADMDMRVSMKNSAFTYTIDKDGQLKNAAVTLNMDFDADVNMGEGERADVYFSMQMDMNMDVKATGETVKITFPDFSGFLQ